MDWARSIGSCHEEAFILAILDLDNFKSINDKHGDLERIAMASYKYNVAGDAAQISFTVSCGVAEFVASFLPNLLRNPKDSGVRFSRSYHSGSDFPYNGRRGEV